MNAASRSRAFRGLDQKIGHAGRIRLASGVSLEERQQLLHDAPCPDLDAEASALADVERGEVEAEDERAIRGR